MLRVGVAVIEPSRWRLVAIISFCRCDGEEMVDGDFSKKNEV